MLFGVGIFSPLNWMIRDPGILSMSAMAVSAVPGITGFWVSLMVWRVRGVHGDHYVLLIFACFCVFLAYYVLRGLLNETIAFDKAPRNLRFSLKQVAYYTPVLFVASVRARLPPQRFSLTLHPPLSAGRC